MLPRELHVFAISADEPVVLGRLGRLACAYEMDHRPDDRAVGDKEPQQRQAGIDPARLEATVKKLPGETRRAAVEEIHHEECDLAHEVAPTQGRIEFDTVEGHELTV